MHILRPLQSWYSSMRQVGDGYKKNEPGSKSSKTSRSQIAKLENSINKIPPEAVKVIVGATVHAEAKVRVIVLVIGIAIVMTIVMVALRAAVMIIIHECDNGSDAHTLSAHEDSNVFSHGTHVRATHGFGSRVPSQESAADG